MQMVLNMHIHKPGHASLMTRGGWIQSFAPLLMHCEACGAPLLALKKTTTTPVPHLQSKCT